MQVVQLHPECLQALKDAPHPQALDTLIVEAFDAAPDLVLQRLNFEGRLVWQACWRWYSCGQWEPPMPDEMDEDEDLTALLQRVIASEEAK